jgi:hypothetical protein
MNKKILGITVILIVCFTVVAFAQSSTWRGTGQIINADTFDIITTFDLRTSGGASNEGVAKVNIRMQLGFPANNDVRTVSGVNQRIIWISVERE